MAFTNANGAPGEGAARQERQSARIDTASNNQVANRKQALAELIDASATHRPETALAAAYRAARRKAVAQ